MKHIKSRDRLMRVPALERALGIVELLASENRSFSFSEISEKFSIPKPSLSRLLHVLMRGDYVRLALDNKRYILGYRFLEISNAVLERLDLRTQARPYMEELVRDTKETVELAILDDEDILFIDKHEGSEAIRLFAKIGYRYPKLHASALGKVFLAYMNDDKRQYLIKKKGLGRVTDKTITDTRRLKSELGRIRQTGYAFDDQEVRIGVRRIASPIFDHTGSMSGVIGIAGPIFRITQSEKDGLGRIVRNTASKISRQLGYKDAQTQKEE